MKIDGKILSLTSDASWSQIVYSVTICDLLILYYIHVSVCHGKDGRCRGHKIGFGLCGNGKSKYLSRDALNDY